MTDEQEYTVISIQKNETGALAEVKGTCSSEHVLFEATLHDAEDPKVPLGFANSSLGGIIGKKRINDYPVSAANFPINQWRNRIILARFSFAQDDPNSSDITWRVLSEIETSKGTLYIRIAMLDSKVQKLISAYKRQYEIQKRKEGLPDTSG